LITRRTTYVVILLSLTIVCNIQRVNATDFNTSSKLKVLPVIVPYKTVAFNPNGDYALIVGPSVIIKYDRKELMQVANNISNTSTNCWWMLHFIPQDTMQLWNHLSYD